MMRKNKAGSLLLAALLLCGIATSCKAADSTTSSGSGTTSVVESANAAQKKMNTENWPEGAVAWLTFPGTEIDGAVMQAEDNDYYLRRNEQGESDVWGCYYMDYECTADSTNIIIYGHSLEDSANADRFSQLKKLNDAEFAAEYDIIELNVGDKVLRYQVFSAGLASNITDTVAITAEPTADEMQQILTLATDRTRCEFTQQAAAGDSILTLITCTSDETSRYIVTAKLIEEA